MHRSHADKSDGFPLPLIRDPQNGGVAVVRIDDPRGGAEGYTFEVTWSAAVPFSANAPGLARTQ
jgi:hypothetical protein